MPFGEELYAGIGGRTGYPGLSYSTNEDDIRQKFTGYQKDNETGLDFAEARMYANNFGRFTAVDPLLASGKSVNPQTFNRYIYCGNNPVACVDPTGLDEIWTFRDFPDGGRQYKHFGSEEEMREWNKINDTPSCDGDPNCVDYQIWGGRKLDTLGRSNGRTFK